MTSEATALQNIRGLLHSMEREQRTAPGRGQRNCPVRPVMLPMVSVDISLADSA